MQNGKKYILKDVFTYDFFLQSYREWEWEKATPCWFTSQMTSGTDARAEWSQGARNFIQVSHMSVAQALGSGSVAFLRPSTESWIGSKAAEIQTSTPVGCHDPGSCFTCYTTMLAWEDTI